MQGISTVCPMAIAVEHVGQIESGEQLASRSFWDGVDELAISSSQPSNSQQGMKVAAMLIMRIMNARSFIAAKVNDLNALPTCYENNEMEQI